jgi:hypothetical protein
LSEVDVPGVVRQLHKPAEGRLSGGPGRVDAHADCADLEDALFVPDSAPHAGLLEDWSGWKTAGISLESGPPMLGNAG